MYHGPKFISLCWWNWIFIVVYSNNVYLIGNEYFCCFEIAYGQEFIFCFYFYLNLKLSYYYFLLLAGLTTFGVCLLCKIKIFLDVDSLGKLRIKKGKVDTLVLTESKLDFSFPTNRFFIKGSSNPFRFERNKNRGSIRLYIKEDMPCKELKLHRHLIQHWKDISWSQSKEN